MWLFKDSWGTVTFLIALMDNGDQTIECRMASRSIIQTGSAQTVSKRMTAMKRDLRHSGWAPYSLLSTRWFPGFSRAVKPIGNRCVSTQQQLWLLTPGKAALFRRNNQVSVAMKFRSWLSWYQAENHCEMFAAYWVAHRLLGPRSCARLKGIEAAFGSEGNEPTIATPTKFVCSLSERSRMGKVHV